MIGIDVPMLGIVAIEFDQHAGNVPAFGIVQSRDVRAAPLGVPRAGQRLGPIKTGVAAGGEHLGVIGEQVFQLRSRARNRIGIRISKRSVNRQLAVSGPAAEHDTVGWPKRNDITTAVKRKAGRARKILQVRVTGDPGHIVHRWHRRQRIGVEFE